MELFLSLEEAADLSILLTYKELEKLKEKQSKGMVVSIEEKKYALESSVELNNNLIQGRVPPEHVLEIIKEWKVFFLNYPERYQQKINVIENIESNASLLIQQK